MRLRSDYSFQQVQISLAQVRMLQLSWGEGGGGTEESAINLFFQTVFAEDTRLISARLTLGSGRT